MNYTEAKELIIKEGLSLEGIAVTVRIGKDPGWERIEKIMEAVDVLIANEDLSQPIDRKIALSLYIIGYHSDVQSLSWQKDKEWRDGEFFQEIWDLNDKIEEYFQGSLKDL